MIGTKIPLSLLVKFLQSQSSISIFNPNLQYDVLNLNKKLRSNAKRIIDCDSSIPYGLRFKNLLYIQNNLILII